MAAVRKLHSIGLTAGEIARDLETPQRTVKRLLILHGLAAHPAAELPLKIVPITFRAACAFVESLHRHNKPPRGHKFSIGLSCADQLVGVVMVGRPVARHFDDGTTAEVNRTCTDGTLNANSMLYGAAWRAAKAMGYTRLITYTQAEESGASLRAAGWMRVKALGARPSWAESSVSLREIRDPVGSGGVPRVLWEVRC